MSFVGLRRRGPRGGVVTIKLSMITNEGLLRLICEEDLAAFQTENAVFMAEKLVAAFPSPESKHLLARAYLQANDNQRAFSTLYPASTPKNRSIPVYFIPQRLSC